MKDEALSLLSKPSVRAILAPYLAGKVSMGATLKELKSAGIDHATAERIVYSAAIADRVANKH